MAKKKKRGRPRKTTGRVVRSRGSRPRKKRTKKRSKKKTTSKVGRPRKKRGKKKRSKKGHIPIDILEKRFNHLGRLIRRRGGEAVC